jgi:hypothetical protein
LNERLAQTADPADAELKLLVELDLDGSTSWAFRPIRDCVVSHEFRPRPRRLQAMAVCAEDFAFGDFCLDTRPTCTGRKQRRYVGLLVTDVMKLKDHDVRFTAIRTGMLREVVDRSTVILFASCRGVA